jgi:hypothetical protein
MMSNRDNDIDFTGNFSTEVHPTPRKIQILEDFEALKRSSTKDIVVGLAISHLNAWLFMVFCGIVVIAMCVVLYWGKSMGITVSQIHQDWIWILGTIFGGSAILHFVLDVIFGISVKTFFKYTSIVWLLIIFQVVIDFMGWV